MSLQIAFYIGAKGHWWDKLIAWRTGGKYSHCELVFSDGMSYSASPREGCTRFKQIDFTDGKWDLLPVLGVDPAKERQLRNWCEGMCGLIYNWPGVIGLGLQVNLNAEKWAFCSQIVVEVLHCCGFLKKIVGYQTSPVALFNEITAWNEALTTFRYDTETAVRR